MYTWLNVINFGQIFIAMYICDNVNSQYAHTYTNNTHAHTHTLHTHFHSRGHMYIHIRIHKSTHTC